MDQEVSPPDKPPDAGAQDALVGQVIADRYQLLAKTSGGLVHCYVAQDNHSGEKVFLQLLDARAIEGEVERRIAFDVAMRRRVQGRFLITPLDHGRDADWLFVVSELQAGPRLSERLQTQGLPFAETLELSKCLFAALDTLHVQRVLHRDIRPASIATNPGDSLTDAKLLNLCTTIEVPLDQELDDAQLEKARYISPEQAGAIEHDVGEASDLYSAGVVLFECVTGRPPFDGDDAGSILFEHMTANVPQLRSAGLGVPRAFEEIVHRLLKKDPRDRYQRAEAVLADLEAISQAIDNGEEDPELVIGGLDRRRTITEPSFVGRGNDLAQFDVVAEGALRGAGGLITLEGASGSGKSRLLVEVAQRTRRLGVWVLRGQGSTEVGQRPFRMIEGIVDAFVAATRSDPTLADRVRDELGPECGTVCEALPELAQALVPVPQKGVAPEAFGELRIIQALAAFLDAISSAERPALVVLDDCQWADQLTVRLLHRWHARRSECGARHTSVVAVFRSEEVGENHLLRKLTPDWRCALEPFGPDEIRQLVESMAGSLPKDALETVLRLAGGSPFMASAVLRGLVETGALVAHDSGWRVEPLEMANLQSSSASASFLTRRL